MLDRGFGGLNDRLQRLIINRNHASLAAWKLVKKLFTHFDQVIDNRRTNPKNFMFTHISLKKIVPVPACVPVPEKIGRSCNRARARARTRARKGNCGIATDS